MNQTPQDLRTQTLELVTKAGNAAAPVVQLVQAWLDSLDAEDLADIAPESLAPVLVDGFTQAAQRTGSGCQIATLRYADGRGGTASALLILNQDMPYLVDSIVMAMRRQHLAVRGVMNTVLPVRRAADGKVEAVRQAGDPLESYVLCLLDEELSPEALAALVAAIDLVARDAAIVRRDAGAMSDRLASVAAAQHGEEGAEVAAFLEWARGGGFEVFGYAYYRVKPGVRELERDIPSRVGVLQDTAHPVYGSCLANIPGDFDTLSKRESALSIVKADVAGTLHRDQQLDFIGVRDTDAQGAILGEHCFVGLFTRAGNSTPLAALPFARGRVAKVLSLAGVRQQGFRAEKFREILESLPRTEALEADLDWLAQVCGAVVSLYKQPRTKVFARRDVYARHLNVLVYLPRERYSASVASSLAKALQRSSGATHVSTQTLVADGPLARVYLIAHAARYPLDLETDIEQPLLGVLDGWHNGFSAVADAVPDVALRTRLRKLCATLPLDYVAATAPAVAVRDLDTILRNGDPAHISARIETGDITTIRLYSANRVPSLSTILPALHNAGVAIDREQTYSISSSDGTRYYVTSLTVDAASAAKLAQPEVVAVAQELFAALFNDSAEDGRLNGLVIEGGLSTREVQLVRAYTSYWRQTGSRFSVRYIAESLRKQPAHVKALVDAFLQRFNPALPGEQHAAALASLATIKAGLPSINHADTEEILGALADLMSATLRTNYFQNDQQGDKIIFKFDTSSLALVPEPRPYREIFVFSRRFEGVHLRGGPVARGGLRWSDRMEDYRTEVLGLVKAQMVKNAVIVPAGAKGGFVCKMMPQDAVRETIAAEGEAVYRLFISSLLEVTDNRSLGNIVPPSDTVCFDEADPYLVVAADKGTATFSDIANGIAVQRGFWLGDAFASGGSNGYDHKKLGITAKGAFEAVKRHFYEMDHNLNTTPITMVGVGDMSGDVFGNGVLLSRQLKLVAAFDHRHIFLDPTPDVAVSFAERARLFALPRSSWDDYNKELISAGGGVYPRSARTIALSPEIRAALDISETSLAPEELMHRILKAPVDLFYNGGIGTYIKASTESHAQVKDRANDHIRVNGNELRVKVVAEGGNLGATQAGRIEFALAGGRIFTDAIDNSAGVDCSDHEVNVKIWLDVEVNAGKLSEADRNRELYAMTDDVERLVLRDNTQQTHLLVRELQAQSESAVQDGYAALIASLEEEGALSRELEQLPSVAELARRKLDNRGLTTPELAVVIANVKNRYKRILSSLPLTDETWAAPVLTPYFPSLLVATRSALDHPLANAILATVLANEVVNRCGPLMLRELAAEHGVEESSVILAWGQAWVALNLAPVFDALDADALTIPRAVSIKVDAQTRALQQTMIAGVLAIPAEQLRGAGLAELTRLFGAEAKRDLLKAVGIKSEAALVPGLNPAFVQAWDAVDALEVVAGFLFPALSVQRPASMDLAAFLQVGLALRSQAGIDTLERGLKLAASGKSQEQLRSYAQQALRRTQQRLLTQVLASAGAGNASQAVDAVTGALGLSAYVAATELEQAMLDVWTLSEAVNKVTTEAAV
ncbi:MULTISPECIES: NAD-glutamate dehydrogenase domain-containing protein [unclassified Janthinobacterium]|uniref:NAD-glutamate dehydrogenase domain-containing protein n=1 Tax=unclassified Janthinobacterium TaxID=2610881 RepID=UPI00161A55A6|nr:MULTISPECIES: NAD-glutamate dehydrogenase domain-containing protein [unclassified Janthinobacterium]MBB5371209.1 glutamate dehydrogenase [Janthinobacterium sp. K2C7]MBB5384015.1 glutamate dehydrogenase [Janthinobacterium sp. K2Li3]MBB5389163.1 glutamate dehydrogenase [Janthinobacterium sp. K2E3]